MEPIHSTTIHVANLKPSSWCTLFLYPSVHYNSGERRGTETKTSAHREPQPIQGLDLWRTYNWSCYTEMYGKNNLRVIREQESGHSLSTWPLALVVRVMEAWYLGYSLLRRPKVEISQQHHSPLDALNICSLSNPSRFKVQRTMGWVRVINSFPIITRHHFSPCRS